VTAGVTYDSMTDVPTLTSATAANTCTLNPITAYSASIGTISNGNLSWSQTGTAAYGKAVGTIGMVGSGKFYWEITLATGTNFTEVGILLASDQSIYYTGYSPNGYVYYKDGTKGNNNTYPAYGASFTVGDVIGVAFDCSTGTLTFYKNNTSQGTAFTGLTGTYLPAFSNASSNSANVTNIDINWGQRPFSYTPPTGYVALNTYNLTDSTIKNGAAYMNAVARSGTGATATVAIAFQPDWIWSKCRTNAVDNILADSNRGLANTLFSNLTLAEDTTNAYAFTTSSTGYGFNSSNGINGSGRTYVDWVWKAGGTAVSNTSGSITSSVSANTIAGFSVVTYTGNGTNGATVGHGLGVIPSLIIEKGRTSAYNWSVQGCGKLWTPATSTLFLNTTGGLNAGGAVAAPTSSVFTPSVVAYANESTVTNVAYVFAAVAGYSAFGLYTGNGSTDGTFVYLGFRPRFVMVKRTDTAGNDWIIWDTSRDTYNVMNDSLAPNLADAEKAGTTNVDFLSNGFKLRFASSNWNTSGATYIYACFAEVPFKSALAR
jgi:hypothetical protein